MRSVSEFSQPAQKLFMINKKQLRGFFDKSLHRISCFSKAKISKTYLPNGYVDILKTKFFLNNKLYGKNVHF